MQNSSTGRRRLPLAGLQVAIALSLIAAACQTESTRMGTSGFLKNTSELQPSENGETLTWWSDAADLSHYDKVLMLPVEIWLASDAEYRGVRPSELDQLADAFFLEVSRELAGGYPMTDQAGKGVLVVRAALTDVRPGNPTGNTITSIPGVRLIDRAAVGVAGTHLYVGEVVMEAEFLDGVTGDRIMAIVDRRTGRKHLNESNTRWGDVEAAFRQWGRGLRAELDQARAVN